MQKRKESDFAEVLVDRLILESFSNERSLYFSPDSDRGRNESLDRFRRRIRWHIARSLSPRQKEVIQYYLAGKKEREIAHDLGVTQQVVNIYKHRAIKKLQKLLA